jgi:hypothetical protein
MEGSGYTGNLKSRFLRKRLSHAKIAARYLVLCLFFLFFFLRLCVAIFLSFRLRPQGTLASPWRGDPSWTKRLSFHHHRP